MKSTSFYQLFTTYVSLALHQMVTSVLILYPKTYTILNSSKTNYCAIIVGLEVQNMNHIKRGHYLSLKPQKKRHTRRVHGSPYINCVRGTRTQPLICVGCYVPYWVSCAINKGGYFEIAFSSSSTHICLTLTCLLTFCLTLTR